MRWCDESEMNCVSLPTRLRVLVVLHIYANQINSSDHAFRISFKSLSVLNLQRI